MLSTATLCCFRRHLTAANKLAENKIAQAKRCDQKLNDTTKQFEKEKGLASLCVFACVCVYICICECVCVYVCGNQTYQQYLHPVKTCKNYK